MNEMEKRILIVDDDEKIGSIVSRRLTLEGFSWVTARNGREALQYFQKENFSLIISDIKMPEMNGLELLKEVKALDQKMVVVMMTAYPEIDLAVAAMHAGAYDFIIKPFDLDLAVFSIRKGLEKRKLEEEIENYHLHLEKLVEEKTARLRGALSALRKSNLDTVKVLVGAIDAKDPHTRGHADRVREICLKIGMKSGFNGEKLEGLEYGALLHDIGKLGIKDKILQKQTPLTPEEYRHIQEHPLIGVKILEGIDFFRNQIFMVRHHHERFDGGGYPDQLAGKEIPLEARIISVADAFDAMTSTRPHRSKRTIEDTFIEMEKERGKHFDPDILDIFLRENFCDLTPESVPDKKCSMPERNWKTSFPQPQAEWSYGCPPGFK